MKINVQIEYDLNNNVDVNTINNLQNWIFSYNMTSQIISADMNPIRTEICDNSDGTVEFRILDFEYDDEQMNKANQLALEYLEKLDLDIDDLLNKMGGNS